MFKCLIRVFAFVFCFIINLYAMPDFSSYKDSREKKQAFFSYLTPHINQINEDIYNDRQYILKLMSKIKSNNSIQDIEKRNLLNLFQKYNVNKNEINTQSISDLLKRVDVIPVSLVLAQAANESAWGTSKFAVKGNNLFGQWCYKKGCGLVPASRESGMKHEVKKFNSTKESIRSYIMNINCHFAYSKLRDIRANLRKNNRPLTGKELANGLDKYSERGYQYTKDIISMIKFNNLEKFNNKWV